MTDLDLQQAIINELKGLAQSHSLKKLDGEVWKDYNIYSQEQPLKDDDYDEGEEDYILVILNDEDTDEDGRWLVEVHIVISIMLYENQHQGNIILADLMNQIDLHFCKKGVIAGRYEMEVERHKRFNQECLPNYYECDYITKWKLPEEQMEGIDDLL